MQRFPELFSQDEEVVLNFPRFDLCLAYTVLPGGKKNVRCKFSTAWRVDLSLIKPR